MDISDSGVFEPSFMEFSIPSEFARQSLYYVPQFGHFYCNESYSIKRESLDLFLMIYLRNGAMKLSTGNREYQLGPDQIAIIDCRKPHYYYCTEESEFLWFHYNGCSSIAYTELLLGSQGAIYSGEIAKSLERSFERIFTYSLNIPNDEHLVSLHVTQLLGRLASPSRQRTENFQLSPALKCIRDHYMENLPLEDLAAMCHMSVSHFIRSFNRYMNKSPHEYLLFFRLRQAKQLLLSTQDSVEEIAYKCGFNSASHFARAFRKANDISPKEFRNIQF